jgi:hypothetical protein
VPSLPFPYTVYLGRDSPPFPLFPLPSLHSLSPLSPSLASPPLSLSPVAAHVPVRGAGGGSSPGPRQARRPPPPVTAPPVPASPVPAPGAAASGGFLVPSGGGAEGVPLFFQAHVLDAETLCCTPLYAVGKGLCAGGCKGLYGRWQGWREVAGGGWKWKMEEGWVYGEEWGVRWARAYTYRDQHGTVQNPLHVNGVHVYGWRGGRFTRAVSLPGRPSRAPGAACQT